MNRRHLLIRAGAAVALGSGATLLTLSGMGSSADYAADINRADKRRSCFR